MNNLEVLGQVKTIPSYEVAEMMEIEHGKLLRKIDGINEDLQILKDNFGKYWIESVYVDKKGESRRCYEITRLGCELLIQKSTGKKGFLLAHKLDELFPNETNSIIIAEIDRKEIEFLDSLEDALESFNIKGLRQYQVMDNKYRIDYYIPSLNIAIEYDEDGHRGYSYEKHEGRQKEIEDLLKCRFIRVSDDNTNSYNIGFVIKNIFNL